MTKLLIIEDDQGILDTVVDTLEFAGYDVETASDGQQGITLAQTCDPDLILCDIMMPINDGYEVLAELNKIPKLSSVPFIFLTAKATKTDVRKGMSLGADDYLTKPFSAEELLEAVQSRLDRHAKIHRYDIDQLESIREYLNSTIPHELRTPLNGIIGFLSVLEDGLSIYSTDEIAETLGYIRRSADRLEYTIENFILYSQLQFVKNEEAILAKIHQHSHLKGIDIIIRHVGQSVALTAERPEDLSVSTESADVFIISDHAEKLVEFIVDNAFKFSAKGTPVKISSTVNDDFYTIAVTNEGRGFTQEQINNIRAFNQFERSKFEQQGTGLGLALVKSFLEIYGGTMTIDSEPNVTTTVSVTLKVVHQLFD